MKLVKNLALFLIVIAFTGCASTSTASKDADVDTTEDTGDSQEELKTSGTHNTLIDRYISGDIPGYNE